VLQAEYLTSILKWLKPALHFITEHHTEKGLYFFGPGYDGWGMQTTQKAFAAFAVAATSEEYDETTARMTREETLQYALGLFRYCIRTHKVGDILLNDGMSWGNTWISALGTERMMHGVDAIWDHLNDEDKASLKILLADECDWLLNGYPIEADPISSTRKNKPESNIWNGAILLRTAMMYPDLPHKEEYEKKGNAFFINGISITGDQFSDEVYDGHKISDLFVGANFFDTYSLDHHGYLNIGYMAICLSNIAMLHFFCRMRGIEAPQCIHHHAAELWKLLKTCTFPDGRLCRIGGDSRVRYCYCQDYLIPALLYARDALRDTDTYELEAKWQEQMLLEQSLNADRSYLGDRAKNLKVLSPLYYTRLESDRAVAASMGYLWNKFLAEESPCEENRPYHILDSWHEEFHGACMTRDERRIASFVWSGAQGPTGLCVPSNNSNMAEWSQNMVTQVIGATKKGRGFKPKWHKEYMFDGGFITMGDASNYYSNLSYMAESERGKDFSNHSIMFAALPDESTVVCMQLVRAQNRVHIFSVKGMFLQIPNDIFNGNCRFVCGENFSRYLESIPEETVLIHTYSDWINIDDCLGVIKGYGKSKIQIYRNAFRQIGIKDKPMKKEFLYAEEFCMDTLCSPFWAVDGEVIADAGFVVKAGVNSEKTKEAAALTKAFDVSTAGCGLLRWIVTTGEDGRKYLTVANFGEKVVTMKPDARHIKQIGWCGDKMLLNNTSINIASNSSALFEIE
jgi:hypothetical protein